MSVLKIGRVIRETRRYEREADVELMPNPKRTNATRAKSVSVSVTQQIPGAHPVVRLYVDRFRRDGQPSRVGNRSYEIQDAGRPTGAWYVNWDFDAATVKRLADLAEAALAEFAEIDWKNVAPSGDTTTEGD